MQQLVRNTDESSLVDTAKKVLPAGTFGNTALDIVIELDGWIGDNAATFPVGPVSPAVDKLLRVTREVELNLGYARTVWGRNTAAVNSLTLSLGVRTQVGG